MRTQNIILKILVLYYYLFIVGKKKLNSKTAWNSLDSIDVSKNHAPGVLGRALPTMRIYTRSNWALGKKNVKTDVKHLNKMFLLPNPNCKPVLGTPFLPERA